jgi:hypothetical protein
MPIKTLSEKPFKRFMPLHPNLGSTRNVLSSMFLALLNLRADAFSTRTLGWICVKGIYEGVD